MNNQNSFNIVERAIAILGLVGTTAFFGLPAVANFSQKSSTQSLVNQPLQIADSNSKDIVATAAEAGQFNTLAAALKAAGLVEVLQGEGPFTVFAPTDKAFAALPAGTVEKLLLPENKDKLVKILTYHVVPGKVMSGDLESGMVKTVEGSKVNIDVSNSGVKVGKA
ncbi:MAG: fasciclin domain-containing protein, partial [Okeania sp. SIO2H7]|nr:fasciclin domain-containing protein [Okeania sp. SIO2H7]